MECFRCEEAYDRESHRPKLLPCGHTYCLSCLQGAGECFSDGEAFPGAACLPDDEYTLGLVTGRIRRHPDEPAPGQLQLWCRACAAAADDGCVDDGHAVITRRHHCHEQVLERLERLAAVLDEEEEAEPRVDEELERLVGSAGVRVTLEDGADGDQWTCNVQLGGPAEEGTDESWALRHLLLVALRDRALEKDEFVPPPDTPPNSLSLLGLGEALFDEKQSKGPSGRYSDDFGFGLFGDDMAEDLEAGLAALEDGIDDYPADAAEALEAGQLAEVRKITDLDFFRHGEQLRLLAPQLEELQVLDLTRKHLMLIQSMPRLRRLEVTAPRLWTDPFEVPPALEHGGGLEHLKVCLCAPTAASLIYAHNRTLRLVQIVVPRKQRREGRWRDTVYFESLDYLGAGRVGLPHVFRSPYFPRREPGDFPVLERVEFLEEPRDPHVCTPSSWIVGKDLDRIEKLLPGVKAELVFRKRPLNWNAI